MMRPTLVSRIPAISFVAACSIALAICAAACFPAVAEEPAGNQRPAPLLDAYGDPLPPQAILRLGTMRLHHQSFIQDTAFSPDGRILASAAANQDTAIALWDVPSGRLLRRLQLPRKDEFSTWANALAFSPDGKKLATADIRGTLRLWDVAGGGELYSLEAHPGWHGATAVAFSADGQWFASGGGDGVVRVWSSDSGHELLSFDMLSQPPGGPVSGGMGFAGVFPPGCIAALSFSPDGKFLAAGIAQNLFPATNGKIRIWDLESNQPVCWIDGPKGLLSSLVYTPDGKQLISGGSVAMSREKLAKPFPFLQAQVVRIRVWDADSGNMLRQLAPAENEPGLGALSLSQDGRTLAAGYDNKVLIWDVESATVRREINVPNWRGDRGLALSPDGQVVCAPLNNMIGLWSTATGQSLVARAESHSSFVDAVAYTSDGRSIVTSGDSTVRIWDAGTGRQKWSRLFGPNAYVGAIAVSPDGSLVAAGGQVDRGETGVWILQTATGDEVGFIRTSDKRFYRGVRALVFSPDGSLLAVSRQRPKDPNANDIDLFVVASGNKRAEIATGFDRWTNAMAFSADLKLLYAVDQAAVVGVWDTTTGQRRRQFTALKPPPEVPGGKPEKPWTADAVFAPDLKTLVTSQNRDLVVWDVERGVPTATLPAEGTLKGGKIALSQDGRLLAMTDLLYAGDPGSDAIRIFDLQSRRRVATLEPDAGRPSSFAFSPDGRRLVTGMSDGTALVWDLAVPSP